MLLIIVFNQMQACIIFYILNLFNIQINMNIFVFNQYASFDQTSPSSDTSCNEAGLIH